MKFLHFLQRGGIPQIYHKKKLLCKLELVKVQFLTKNNVTKKVMICMMPMLQIIQQNTV
jgi:hypothetical protein